MFEEMPYLDEAAFVALAEEVLSKAREAENRATRSINANVIDPFSAVFDAARTGKTLEEWFDDERGRQIQKTLQNAIGTFHQKLLGTFDGWTDTASGGGIDLRSTRFKTIAEVKNKYNTMNSASGEATFQKLANHLRYTDAGFTAYVVFIVPKNPARFDRPWTHSARIASTRDDVREIDGYSFYGKVTGDPEALKKIYKALLGTLANLTGDNTNQLLSDPQAKLIFSRVYGK